MKVDFDHLFKILVIGDSGVGKSSLISKLCNGKMQDSYVSTIGVDFNVKTMIVDGKIIKLQIWDTAGQERFKSVTTSYYRGAIGVLIVYDINDKRSFDNIKNWLREVNIHASENICKFVIGNKKDKIHREIHISDAIDLAKDIGAKYYETSAKTGGNIEEIFRSVCGNIYVDRIEEKKNISREIDITCGNGINKKSCCT